MLVPFTDMQVKYPDLLEKLHGCLVILILPHILLQTCYVKLSDLSHKDSSELHQARFLKMTYYFNFCPHFVLTNYKAVISCLFSEGVPR